MQSFPCNLTPDFWREFRIGVALIVDAQPLERGFLESLSQNYVTGWKVNDVSEAKVVWRVGVVLWNSEANQLVLFFLSIHGIMFILTECFNYLTHSNITFPTRNRTNWAKWIKTKKTNDARFFDMLCISELVSHHFSFLSLSNYLDIFLLFLSFFSFLSTFLNFNILFFSHKGTKQF